MGDGNANNPDQVVLSELVFTRNDKAIYFDWGDGGPGNDLTDYFAVIWEGQLKIVENGTYTFTLTSDDGSWLWIDGKLVINNGGLHGAQSVSNSTYHTKGIHSVKVIATCIV
ncbi:PA14 domain-containing protein [Archaeoglobus sp.]